MGQAVLVTERLRLEPLADTGAAPPRFVDLGLSRIRAQTKAVNTASRATMASRGLRYVRTFHEHFDDPLPGTEHGEVEHEIRRADWPAT